MVTEIGERAVREAQKSDPSLIWSYDVEPYHIDTVWGHWPPEPEVV